MQHRCSQMQSQALAPDTEMLGVVPGKELGGAPLTAHGGAAASVTPRCKAKLIIFTLTLFFFFW